MDSVTLPLKVACISLTNFRCFKKITVNLDSSIVLLYGINGTGKTSILEALHYSCYLKSFRTHLSRDIVALEKDSFFIRLSINDNNLERTITIGFSHNKRLVKIDNKPAVSYKELLQYYRVISLTEDDLMLIKGSPEERRTFLDQALFLYDHSFISTVRTFKAVLENRNSLLQSLHCNREVYEVLTQQLWQQTQLIQIARKRLLQHVQVLINELLTQYFKDEFTISFVYRAKKQSDHVFEQFSSYNTTLQQDELRFKRSLFGAHLDDFEIIFEGKKSKIYASRGQQKLVVLLIKIAQMKLLTQYSGPGIFLLDDFLTDFDLSKMHILLSILVALDCQLIFTSPSKNSPIEQFLAARNDQYRVISI